MILHFTKESIFSAMILLLSFMSLSAQNNKSDSKVDSDCVGRFSEPGSIRLVSMESNEVYQLRFQHEIKIENNYNHFPEGGVKSYWFENNLLHFIPLQKNVYFHYPASSCNASIVQKNLFQLKNTSPKKSNSIIPITGETPQFLVENVLLGDFCLNISNVSAPAGGNSIGQFFGGQGSINVETGIMLVNGDINQAVGPNNSTGTSSTTAANLSDPDIEAISGSVSRDASILEFDFVPDQDSIKFDYVFASEEYCEYVGGFNDAFGFFLSGPGINGPYTDGAENIAILPDNVTPVSINTVNFGLNGQYYESNAVPPGTQGDPDCDPNPTGKFNQFIEYDGFTTVLEAKAAVQACETYHIKIVVADALDQIFDSAVFLGSNSFISGDPGLRLTTEVGYTNPTEETATEGCSGAYISFVKFGGTFENMEFTINIDNTSTATEGVDYADLPSTFTIPPGVTVDTLWLDIFNDDIEEGVETIDITIGGLCDCLDPVLQIQIDDPEPLVIDPIDDIGVCSPEVFQIPAIASGGTAPYTYSWSNGSSDATAVVFVNQSGFYDVTVTDECGQEETAEFYAEIYPNYEESQTVEICEGDSYFVGGAPQSTTGNYVDLYPTVFGCDSIITTSLIVKPKAYYDTLVYSCVSEPVVINGTTLNFPGVFDIPLFGAAANGCDSIVNVEVVWLNPISSIDDPDLLTCDVDSVQLSIIVPNEGDGFEYFWTGPNSFESSEESPWAFDAGTYTLTVTQTINGVFCESVFPFSNEVEIDTLAPIIDSIPDVTISCGLSEVTIDASIVNLQDLSEIEVEWSGPNGFLSDQLTITVSDSGAYVLNVLNPLTGCSSFEAVDVSIDNIEPTVNSTGGSIGCSADSIQIYAEVNLLNGSFSWTGPNGFLADSQNPFVYESGTYIVEYNLTNQCIAYDTVLVINDNTVPDISTTPDTVFCGQGIGELIAFSMTPNVIYSWEGPNGFVANSATIDVTEEGIYTVSITGENGCLVSEDVEFLLIDVFPTATTALDTIDCGEDFITLPLSTSDSDLSFAWTGPSNFSSTDQNPTTNIPGEYQVIITTDLGCSSTLSTTISADTLIPQVTVVAPTITCDNPLPAIEVSDINEVLDFSWIGPNGFNSTQESPIVDQPGQYELTISSLNGCDNSYNLTIPIDTLSPSFTATGDTIDCINGSAFVSSDLSGGQYEVLWTDENNNTVGLNFDEEVSVAGLYTIVASFKDNGCSTTRIVEVFKNDDVPDISILGDTLNCLSMGGLISSDSQTPGVTYSWTGPNGFSSSSNSTSVNEGGLYNLTITAPNGCIATASTTVVEDQDDPDISIDPLTLDCYTTSSSISINTTGQGNQYSWIGPNGFSSNLQSPTINENGMYEVTVTSENGCSSVESILVNGDFVQPTALISTPDIIDCNNPSVDIDLSSNAPIGSTFSWTGPNSFSSDEKDLSVDQPGLYSVIVTGTNGCTNLATTTIDIDIEPIQLTTEDDFIDCDKPSVELSITYSNNQIFDLQWDGPNNFTSVQLKPTIDQGGTYTLQVVGLNGCTSNTSIFIEDRIEYPNFSLSGNDLSCEEEVSNIFATIASGDFSFAWEDAQDMSIGTNSDNIQVNEEGYYYTTITDNSNGCSTIDSIEIFQLPELNSFEFESENPNCFVNYGTIDFTDVQGGTEPYEYSINGGSNFSLEPFFDEVEAGNYDLMVIDANGCELLDDATIIGLEEFDISSEELYTIVLGNNQQLEVQTSIPQADIQNITWVPEDFLSCTNCLNPISNPNSDIVYLVILTDKNGCELQTEIEIRVVDNPIYVPNIFTPNNDGINEEFTILGDLSTIETINTFSIYDRWGEQVFLRENIDPSQDEITWDGRCKDQTVKVGVYAYYLEYVSIRGELEQLVGNITVVR